jgi:hypothetical protein
MASVAGGSKLAFFATNTAAPLIGLALTDGTTVPVPVAGATFNIEVFTASPSGGFSLAPGFQGSAFIQGATAIAGDNNEIIAGSATATEQLLAGSFEVLDHAAGQSSGGELIQIIGNAASATNPSNFTVIGSAGDTITGSSIATNIQTIEANPNADVVTGPITIVGGAGQTNAVAGLSDSIVGGAGAILVDSHPASAGGSGGADTIVGGSGNMTVWGAGGDSVLGGSGALLVNEAQGFSGQERITGGAGSLLAFSLGKNETIVGSTGGTTNVDDSYLNLLGNAAGGNSLITGGSGTTGTLSVGENTYLKAAAGDKITGGTDLTLIDGTVGNVTVVGGSGTVAGAIAGSPVNLNTAIEGGKFDAITAGAGATGIDGTPGSMTITGGTGSTTVLAGGGGDKITGGTGLLTVIDPNAGGGSASISGGTGNLDALILGKSETISGGTGWTVVNDSYAGSGISSITGGSGTSAVPAGTLGFPAGSAANTMILGGVGDTINGGSGSMSVIGGTSDSITGASGANGATTITGANLDTITGNTGTLTVFINETTAPGAGSGNETINLGAGHGAAILQDVALSASATTGGATNLTSVTGFATGTDKIASGTSVNSSNVFLGTSNVSGGNTTLTFLDGSKMTLVGVTGTINFIK